MKAADMEGTRAGCSDGVTVGTVERPEREVALFHHYLRGSPAARITTRKTSLEERNSCLRTIISHLTACMS